MQLITFTEAGNTRIGLLQDDAVVDLAAVATELIEEPSDTASF